MGDPAPNRGLIGGIRKAQGSNESDAADSRYMRGHNKLRLLAGLPNRLWHNEVAMTTHIAAPKNHQGMLLSRQEVVSRVACMRRGLL
ncbi:hypothetical protein [Mycobacterium sp.]|uniref:hypothetical protein n=1 Tax=Mycobacterium sp. TaxID=1785 RepID=UPI003C7268CC